MPSAPSNMDVTARHIVVLATRDGFLSSSSTCLHTTAAEDVLPLLFFSSTPPPLPPATVRPFAPAPRLRDRQNAKLRDQHLGEADACCIVTRQIDGGRSDSLSLSNTVALGLCRLVTVRDKIWTTTAYFRTQYRVSEYSLVLELMFFPYK